MARSSHTDAMESVSESVEPVQLRPSSQVMKLTKLGSSFQTRLSFGRQLIRRMHQERWQIERGVWDVDSQGVGTAVYTVRGPDCIYSLIAFAHDLDPSRRSDRVIADAWDATFVLYDGVPDASDLVRLKAQVPLQEAGRISGRELTLSRANRSVRLFDYVHDCLARGEQPDPDRLDAVGYLMRTTAVYGSGKFGACDRRFIADRSELAAPFQSEMLTVYLIRTFTFDIVDHLAAVTGGSKAHSLAPALKRRLGVGNATGLGMAPFIVNHPALLNQWVLVRETALTWVRQIDRGRPECIDQFRRLLACQIRALRQWPDNSRQANEKDQLRKDLSLLAEMTNQATWVDQFRPWDFVFTWGQDNLSDSGLECLVCLILEPHGELIDELADAMSIEEEPLFAIDGTMRVADLLSILRQGYRFAGDIEFDRPEHSQRFWYVSQAKLEPRLGDRYEEPGSDLEHPLATARDIAELLKVCVSVQDRDWCVADLLYHHPQLRHSVRRVQISVQRPYAEIQDNLIGHQMLPLDMLRCKLAFFGATRFDPKSDRWIRITLFQHAPLPAELGSADPDQWAYAAGAEAS